MAVAGLYVWGLLTLPPVSSSDLYMFPSGEALSGAFGLADAELNRLNLLLRDRRYLSACRLAPGMPYDWLDPGIPALEARRAEVYRRWSAWDYLRRASSATDQRERLKALRSLSRGVGRRDFFDGRMPLPLPPDD